jgi:hypothetical protein
MRRHNNQLPLAHQIPPRTEHPSPVRRILRDPAAVLPVLGIPEQGRARDAVPHGRAQIRDGGGDERGALAVASRHDGRVGTLGRRELQQADALADGGGRGAPGEGVACEGGVVGASYALDPEAADAAGEGAGEVRADSCALGRNGQCLGEFGGFEGEDVYHVADLGRAAGEDEDTVGAVGGAASLEFVTGAGDKLAVIEIDWREVDRTRSSGGEASQEGDGGEELHVGYEAGEDDLRVSLRCWLVLLRVENQISRRRQAPFIDRDTSPSLHPSQTTFAALTVVHIRRTTENLLRQCIIVLSTRSKTDPNLLASQAKRGSHETAFPQT